MVGRMARKAQVDVDIQKASVKVMQKANADISSRMSAFEKAGRAFPRRAPPRRTPTPTLQEHLIAERDPHVPKSCPPLDSLSTSFSVVPNRLTKSPSLNSLTLRSSPIYDHEGTTQIGHRPVAHILPNAPRPENEKDFLFLTQPDLVMRAKIAPRSEPTSCHRLHGRPSESNPSSQEDRSEDAICPAHLSSMSPSLSSMSIGELDSPLASNDVDVTGTPSTHCAPEPHLPSHLPPHLFSERCVTLSRLPQFVTPIPLQQRLWNSSSRLYSYLSSSVLLPGDIWSIVSSLYYWGLSLVIDRAIRKLMVDDVYADELRLDDLRH